MTYLATKDAIRSSKTELRVGLKVADFLNLSILLSIGEKAQNLAFYRVERVVKESYKGLIFAEIVTISNRSYIIILK